MPILGTRMPDYFRSGGNGAKRLRKPADGEPFVAATLTDLQLELVETIALVLSAGGAVHLGMTSDGGALLIRAWIGGDKYEDYVTATPELMETLEALRGEAEGAQHRKPSVRPKAPKNAS